MQNTGEVGRVEKGLPIKHRNIGVFNCTGCKTSFQQYQMLDRTKNEDMLQNGDKMHVSNK